MQFFGANVELLAKVGCDSFGEIIKSSLLYANAICRLKEDAGHATSYSIVIAQPGIDRIFLHCPGANDQFTEADVTQEALEGKALFHFGYPPLMRRMYEDGGRELRALFQKASEGNHVRSKQRI